MTPVRYHITKDGIRTDMHCKLATTAETVRGVLERTVPEHDWQVEAEFDLPDDPAPPEDLWDFVDDDLTGRWDPR